MTDSLPRLLARTSNFRLGIPRTFTVSPDGMRVMFLRAASGVSRVHGLYVHDVATHTERLIGDPALLLGDGAEALTPEEQVRRERLRVTSSGIAAYSTDTDVRTAAFALSSQLFVADLDGSGQPRPVVTAAPVTDPHADPTGRRVAYAGERALHVVDLESGTDAVVIGPDAGDPEEVVWGLAEFIAGEELDRGRGFWWAPDGQRLLVQRYDETPVQIWHISDPTFPERAPRAVRYPRAGTANAIVGLALVGLDGQRVDVDWRSDLPLDGHAMEYLVDVEWSGTDPVLVLLTRDQRRLEYRRVDPNTGATRRLRAVTDEKWVEVLPGTPRLLPDGRLLHSVDVGEQRRLWIDDEPFSPPDVLVRGVLAVDGESVIAGVVPQVGSIALARLGFDGHVEILSDTAGVAAGAYAGGTLVGTQQLPTSTDCVTTVNGTHVIGSVAEPAPLLPVVRTHELGPRGLATTVLMPTGHVPGSRRLPVLMDPYGGPHGQRVINSAAAYLVPQWFAEQGFAVIVSDGRGTGGRGPAWDRLAWHDRLGTADDQVEALHQADALYPDDLDLDRVAVRGWSFGGYLAALCAIRHPDVFAAAIAGAPTTDERLYDTCYSERYLGHPDTDAQVYDEASLLLMAPQLRRPLMIIHGLADDNVYVAHSLQLSAALLAAGRPHEVLPLTGITHMTADEAVAENLLLLQLDFLQRSLGLPRGSAD